MGRGVSGAPVPLVVLVLVPCSLRKGELLDAATRNRSTRAAELTRCRRLRSMRHRLAGFRDRHGVDQRGHGDSDWVATGAYEFADYAADVKVVAAELTRRSGINPIAIDASLGGIAALLAEGESERNERVNVFSALVLVDITPRA